MSFWTAEVQTYLDSFEPNLCLAGGHVNVTVGLLENKMLGMRGVASGVTHCSFGENIFMAYRSLGSWIFHIKANMGKKY